MSALRYIAGYPDNLQQQVKDLIKQQRLGDYLQKRYSEYHSIQNDKALHAHVDAMKQRFLRHAPPINKAHYDSKLDVIHNALGLHTRRSHNHGGQLKARKEIRIASVFKELPAVFLDMIVAHELAHLRELDHNKAFYQLCEHMQPGYAQLEFDLRLFLIWRELKA
ncbi:MAG: DUF45 domain-containing protein [Moraxellaceae bacterium]|nr:DUF45 domain-containing protein [Moraxellaceae bacterium]